MAVQRSRMSMLGLFAWVLSCPRMARGFQSKECTLDASKEGLNKYVDQDGRECSIFSCCSKDGNEARDGKMCSAETCWPGTTFKKQCVIELGGEKKFKEMNKKIGNAAIACNKCQKQEAFWCEKYHIGGGWCGGRGKSSTSDGGPMDACLKMADDAEDMARMGPKVGKDGDTKEFDKACAAMLKAKECYAKTLCPSLGNAAFRESKLPVSIWEAWSKCPGLETLDCERSYGAHGRLTKGCVIENEVIKMKAEEKKEEMDFSGKKTCADGTKRKICPEGETKKEDTKDADKKSDKEDSAPAPAPASESTSATVPTTTAGAASLLLPLVVMAIA